MMEYFQALKIEDWKNLSDIFFSMTGAFIALLAYWSARKTILSPLKTEVLKKQLNAIENVLVYISTNDPAYENFADKIGIFGLWNSAMDYLAHSYLTAYMLENPAPDEQLKDLHASYKRKVERKTFYIPNSKELSKYSLSPDSIKKWRQTPLVGIHLSPTYENYRDMHSSICHSPWLPQEIIRQLDPYVESITHITHELLDSINKAKKEKFDTASDETILQLLKQENFNYMFLGDYNDMSLSKPREHSKRVNERIRYYLKVSKLMK
jgi:hypothetical protein